MKIVSKIINNKLFRSGVCGVVAAALIVKGEFFYGGIATGIGVRELLLAFK